jgi:hypothetical protein
MSSKKSGKAGGRTGGKTSSRKATTRRATKADAEAGSRPAASKRATKKTAKKATTTKRAPSTASPLASGYKASWRSADDAHEAVGQRVAALNRLGSAACDDPDVFAGTIGLLRDTATPLPVRLAALGALQAASFSAASFGARRPTYLAALRAIARDPEPELRQRVLGLLAREGDGRVQQLLLAGLEDPAQALVPPEKALQLLSYDPKAEAYPMARRIVAHPPNAEAKREALRLLAADAKSVTTFERILTDKSELVDIRQLAATALQALAPDRLQTLARDIVLDAGESPELQATSLTALSQFGDAQQLAGDDALAKRVGALHDDAGADVIRQSAEQFLGRYLA